MSILQTKVILSYIEFNQAKKEAKKFDTPGPIKQFKILPEQEIDIDIRKELLSEKELEEIAK